ncbi:nucleotidyltransferase family protein [Pseudomonas sp. X10]
MPCEVAALVLAAGYSQRFGSDKRQQRLDNGQRLLEASLALPCARLNEVWLVLRPDEAWLQLPPGVRVVQGASTRLGMGHSIAAGVEQLALASQAEAVAIFLADMPFIQPGTLDALLARSAAGRICLPSHQGRMGHPVVFGRAFWPQLCQLEGDSGARTVLQRHHEAVHRVEVDDPGILMDIDHPADLPCAQPRLD